MDCGDIGVSKAPVEEKEVLVPLYVRDIMVRYLTYLKKRGLVVDPYNDIRYLSDEEYKMRMRGLWKIHLNVPDKNIEYVMDWLKDNQPYTFKVMCGTEKTFTVYIGSFNNMLTLARTLDDVLYESLGDATEIYSDVHVTERVGARFQLGVVPLKAPFVSIFDESNEKLP